ncbi:hypothetical protein ABPG72_017665, partial [Tetrahymena utriculariae]
SEIQRNYGKLNDFDDTVYSSLGKALSNCTSLSTLILDLRRLCNRNAQKIASAFDNKNNIQTLVFRLNQNKIGSEGAIFLFPQLAKCIYLENPTFQI